MLPNEITIDGAMYRRHPAVPDRVSCWGMLDCHAFVKFEGPTIYHIFEAWKRKCENPGQYGAPSLCPVILLDGQKELRRVGQMIDIERRKDWHLWLDPVQDDPDIARLLASQSAAPTGEGKS